MRSASASSGLSELPSRANKSLPALSISLSACSAAGPRATSGPAPTLPSSARAPCVGGSANGKRSGKRPWQRARMSSALHVAWIALWASAAEPPQPRPSVAAPTQSVVADGVITRAGSNRGTAQRERSRPLGSSTTICTPAGSTLGTRRAPSAAASAPISSARPAAAVPTSRSAAASTSLPSPPPPQPSPPCAAFAPPFATRRKTASKSNLSTSTSAAATSAMSR
mmetsp:Transcript_40710/g.95856  ORF Transcript_40710/g.95856 Transcript_40710/m.95856 type:complete len:225 (-) Transcript_40710:1125-1799(-)